MWYSTNDGRTYVAELPNLQQRMKGYMAAPGSLHENLYGDAGNLELTAAFFKLINVNV
jgi:hypothetical protein